MRKHWFQRGPESKWNRKGMRVVQQNIENGQWNNKKQDIHWRNTYIPIISENIRRFPLLWNHTPYWCSGGWQSPLGGRRKYCLLPHLPDIPEIAKDIITIVSFVPFLIQLDIQSTMQQGILKFQRGVKDT